jgi:hypothetical protein
MGPAVPGPLSFASTPQASNTRHKVTASLQGYAPVKAVLLVGCYSRHQSEISA